MEEAPKGEHHQGPQDTTIIVSSYFPLLIYLNFFNKIFRFLWFYIKACHDNELFWKLMNLSLKNCDDLLNCFWQHTHAHRRRLGMIQGLMLLVKTLFCILCDALTSSCYEFPILTCSCFAIVVYIHLDLF